ncbi:unnamed protein product [Chilo suppressalis]|uniref:Uncharacterized protein n=1 Tax=Chilo suppressalis TaxID=168631 RepID=A0ABN8L5E6_CHISP|nr:unnamed protein product [Chilo suppressalis]
MNVIQHMLASRTRFAGKGQIYEEIPAGLNLGGYSILRMAKSLLFFHRMKLRNMTRFIIYSLQTDLGNMTINANLNLQDLHLMGSYERAIEGQDINDLKYVPTYGMAQILLKNVEYRLEGRLRFLHDNLYIVLVSSSLNFDKALLMYRNNNNSSDCDTSVKLTYNNIEDFVERMKADLDSWLKDYLNHLLIFFKPEISIQKSGCRLTTFFTYQQKRMIILTEYVDKAINFLKRRINEVNATVVKLPNFNIYGRNDLKITMEDGRLSGLDSMHRRSVATGTHVGKVRTVESVVGFSNLKVVYKYTAYLTSGEPSQSGLLILSADELTAQMYISLIKEPETVDINFDSLKQVKEESLTMEGAANRMIGNFKHILEHHVLSIMSNALVHNIRLLRTLAKCEPSFIGNGYDDDSGDTNREDDAAIGEGDYFINREDSVDLELSREDKDRADKYHMKLKESLSCLKLASVAQHPGVGTRPSWVRHDPPGPPIYAYAMGTLIG